MERLNLAQLGLAARIALLLAVGLVALGTIAPIAWVLGESTALSAALLAWSVCVASALAALLVGWLASGAPLVQLGVTMAVRMAAPLAFALLVAQRPAWIEAGVLNYLIVFYLVMLAVETLLSMPARDAAAPSYPTAQGVARHG